MAAAGDIWHSQSYFSNGRSAMGATLLGENVAMNLSANEAQRAFMDSSHIEPMFWTRDSPTSE